MRPILLVPLAAIACFVLLSACMSVDGEGVRIVAPASSTRVGEVEDALTEEAKQRQAADDALAAAQARVVDDLQAGIDPTAALAAFRAELTARSAQQIEALEAQIEQSRGGDVDWLYMVLGLLGVGGLGEVRARTVARKTVATDQALEFTSDDAASMERANSILAAITKA